MALIIFDIDGTLTQSVQADEECFVQALEDICGFKDIDTNWTRYQHVTDAGLFHELHVIRTGRAPTRGEIEALRTHFLRLLASAFSQNPVRAVDGASTLLRLLRESPQHRSALATGAWSDSARLKMTSAGLDFDVHPSASSDDAHERESIISLSRQRARERFGQTEGVVYVGDGVWDARACRNLGIPFIGMGAGAKAARLREEGAIAVLPDFSAHADFFQAVEQSLRI